VVKAGDLVIRLDDSMQSTYLATVKAKADDDTALQQSEVRLDVANASLERNKPLFAQKLIKGDEWGQIQGAAKLAALDVDAAKQTLLQAGLEVNRAEAALDQTRIRAPADAVVVDVMVSAGEAAGNTPLASLAIIDPLKVELFVHAASYASWKVGAPIDLHGSQAPDAVLHAHVKSVDPVADAGTGVVRVQLELPNPDFKILAGQQCGLATATPPAPAAQ
jgi:multidrug efflux pump subunit AcrA (membrane-fusion protein)